MRLVILLLIVITPPAAAFERPSDQMVLLRGLEGRKLVMSTPYGAVSVHFQSEGKLTGRAPFAQSLTDSSPFVDHGEWWVARSLLYIRWNHWLDGKSEAYRLYFSDGKPVRWSGPGGMEGSVRFDDGASGR